MALLDEILAKLDRMSPAELAEIDRERRKEGLLWVPNPGGQTAAVETLADELFFGGEPGGGKSSLLIGLAITRHQKSIVFRREYPQIKGLVDEAARILGNRKSYNASSHIWKLPGRGKSLEFGSVPHEKDVERFQGRDHDLKCFDEITHFSRPQYRYLTLWTRTTTPGQRTRIVSAGNPPTRPEGLWVVEHWAPWLDPRHPEPARPGDLRWAVPADDETDRELFFSTLQEAVEHVKTLAKPPRDPATGEILPPRSRTFIPGRLDENPDLIRSGYAAMLGYADKSLRNLASGKFETAMPDDPWQVIPTEWIIAAEDRWTASPPADTPMTAIGVDVAQGGEDETVLAPRHDWWFAQVVAVPGVRTPNPSDTAALVVKHRRNGAAVIVDCGGGYGGGVIDWLKSNQIVAIAHKGAEAATGRSKDKVYSFMNKRAEVWWRLREALDPDQTGGSPIALPPDPKLRADLAAPRYSIEPRGLLVESKEEIIKRIGRSPDRGDAAVMAWAEGQAALKRGLVGPNASQNKVRPKFAAVGYESMKRRRW